MATSCLPVLPTRCSECNKIPYGGKLKPCSACKSVAYCDRDCQKAHWKVHKSECKKLKKKALEGAAIKVASSVKAKAGTSKTGEKQTTAEQPDGEPAIIVYNSKVAIARTPPTPSDPFVYQQFMPREEYTAYINATKMPCWCSDVGQRQSLLVAFAFDPSEMKADGSCIRSTYLSAFGVNFQVLVSRIVNNICVDLAEEATEKDLKRHSGVSARCTYFFLSGSTANNLVIPPPATGKFKRAGETTCNSHMGTWCSVGLKQSMGLHSLSAVPKVTSSALSSQSFSNEAGVALPASAVCLAVMIEKVEDVSTSDEFELACIKAQLHTYHAGSRPDEEIPEFCKDACRRGLDSLNMGHPVPLVGRIPDLPTSSPSPSPPPGVADLAPKNLMALQQIMESIKQEAPDMQAIEAALGDEELAPVLRGILASPQVAPLFARMVGQMGAGGN